MNNTSYFKVSAILVISVMLAPFAYALATDTSNFTQTINAGTLSTSIVDNSYAVVSSPTVALGAVTFSFACQTSTGTFGASGEKLYVSNPDAADNGWTLTAAPASIAAVWDGAVSDYDFNDPTTSGCTDGGDVDSLGGQLTVNPAAGTLATGQCASCAATNITKGSSTAYSSGVTDSITVLTAAAGSDDIGDWTLTGIGLSQAIPAEQGAASDYDINMVLTVTAS